MLEERNYLFPNMILLLLTCVFNALGSEELFEEELLIKDLGHGFTSFHLNFVSRAPEYEQPVPHHDIIPKSVFDLASKYSVDEVHLSMVRGFWDEERWGRNFVMVASTGAELWTWFKKNTSNVDQAWFELTHALSGQFCASLNRLSGRAHSIIPRWSYRPTGITKLSGSSNDFRIVRYAQMPGESLCSENFTPWMKLLPCKDRKGLASLLLPTFLFRSNYKALTLGLRRICWDPACAYLGFEITQTLTVVFDRRLIYGRLDVSWSIYGLLGSNFRGTCEAAQSSRVFLLTSAVPIKITQSISLQSELPITDPRVQAVYSSDRLFDSKNYVMFTSSLTSSESVFSNQPLLSVTKYVTGSGTADGGIRSLLTSHADFHLSVVYMDALPWYTQVLFSTLKISSRGSQSMEWMEIEPIKSHLVPSLSRERMGALELVISIPPGHEVAISYKFRRVLQRWDEYPPDANRGYFLPAASVSYQIPISELRRVQTQTHPAYRELTLPNWASTYSQLFNRSFESSWKPGDGFVRVNTPVLVITMPTPDFSMPFNALCIVCSVIALLFGSVHKVTAGRLYARLPNEGGPRIIRILRKVCGIVSCRRSGSVGKAKTD